LRPGFTHVFFGSDRGEVGIEMEVQNRTMWLFVILGLLLVGTLVLAAWRFADHRADRLEMDRLIACQPTAPARFSAAMVADLPEPARRYFGYVIAEGTPLCDVARITMSGQFGMGDKAAPNYMDMSATQVLTAPEGFVWKMSGGSGAMRLSGSDSGTWTRFWLNGLIPVARLGGDADHRRSAFGRYVGEAVFWTPAALLPGPGIEWEALTPDSARVTVRQGDLTQSIDVTVAPDGQPTSVPFPRWSNANPDKTYQVQPFGGVLSEFRWFDGFRLPTHVEAGNQFGTDAYFPFFIADVTEIEFPRAVEPR
jgi:hypothetical protein